jgi:hypothetical protein
MSRQTAIHYDAELNVDCAREGDWSTSAYTLPNANCAPTAATSLIAQRNFAYTPTNVGTYPWQALAAENLFGINPETGNFELQGATEFLYNETGFTPRAGVPRQRSIPGGVLSGVRVPLFSTRPDHDPALHGHGSSGGTVHLRCAGECADA